MLGIRSFHFGAFRRIFRWKAGWSFRNSNLGYQLPTYPSLPLLRLKPNEVKKSGGSGGKKSAFYAAECSVDLLGDFSRAPQSTNDMKFVDLWFWELDPNFIEKMSYIYHMWTFKMEISGLNFSHLPSPGWKWAHHESPNATGGKPLSQRWEKLHTPHHHLRAVMRSLMGHFPSTNECGNNQWLIPLKNVSAFAPKNPQMGEGKSFETKPPWLGVP